MFASNVLGFDSLRHVVENPHGAEIIPFDLSGSFEASAGGHTTTALPVRGLSLGL